MKECEDRNYGHELSGSSDQRSDNVIKTVLGEFTYSLIKPVSKPLQKFPLEEYDYWELDVQDKSSRNPPHIETQE